MTGYVSSLDEAFRQTVRQRPTKPAVIYKEEQMNFSELDQMVNDVAGVLCAQGFAKQDRAVIYMPHMPQYLAAWLAIQRLGGVAVPVSHFYGHDILGYIANDSGAETIFCAKVNLEQVIKAIPETSLKKIIVADATELIDTEQAALGQGVEISTLSALGDQNRPLPPVSSIGADDLAEILYTSGTTGMPKGVPLRNGLLLAQMWAAKELSARLVSIGEGITLQGAPLNHILGQEMGLGALLTGDTLVLLENMNLDNLLYNIEKHQVISFFGTPTLCRMLLDHEKLEQYSLKSLRYVFTGGETLTAEIADRWAEKVGRNIYNGYGSTESCGGITGVTAGEPFPANTSGKVLSAKKVILINPETMEPVADGEVGELLVSSEYMPTQYWNNPAETAKSFISIDGTLWYRMGDLVHIDAQGWVFFKARSSEIIKHKGYRVAPAKVEAALYKHEAVSSCGVIGLPDRDVGEKIKAFVVLKANAAGVTVNELIEWCRQSLVAYEVPHYVEFRSTLPQSQSGKILRRKLREEELAKAEIPWN